MGYFLRDVNSGGAQPTPLFGKDRFMQDPVIVKVLTYWETLRAGRIAPMRSEIDPSSITSALNNMFILEYKDPLDVRFRLAGNKLCELMGMELRGMPASALIELGHRDELRRVVDELVSEPKIVELQLGIAMDCPGNMTARMLLLPMQDRFGNICRILGCMTSQGVPLEHPQRFEIKRVKQPVLSAFKTMNLKTLTLVLRKTPNRFQAILKNQRLTRINLEPVVLSRASRTCD